ncbi:MAG TPA: phospholipase D-like domain-containing protein, partial [Usitatibacter sp.]|nr:phospholipase D-like domain-containing protein [Usitatibacter sp.]
MRLSVPSIAGIVVLAVASTLVGVNLFSDGQKKITRRVEHRYDVASPQFVRSMGALLGPPLAAGNRTQTLLNGDQIFPSMLQAIGSAQRTIDFETYIYWSGRVGQAFADALSERARAGVKVHILLDWVGSQKMDKAQLQQMADSGVDIRRYHPLHWYTIDRVNNRTHRKLLVVDGRIGFTGGVGIADEWTGHAQDPQHWRDT